jgi:phenylpropionate dioxygenase-like ring-hydroxylating dioxygenase large terminal subunit
VVASQPDAPAAAFSWAHHWFPVVYARDVGPKDLYPFTLLEEAIVVWRDTTGAARAFADRCPHRLVPLSEGRIAASGEIECPYHGWQFSGDGACTLIPQGGETSNPRACATAYQCEERQGLIWVRLQPAGAPATADDIPTLPELDSDEWFELAPMWRDLPMDYSTLIENVVSGTFFDAIAQRPKAAPMLVTPARAPLSPPHRDGGAAHARVLLRSGRPRPWGAVTRGRRHRASRHLD